jgi:MSHA biogenesis protein MshQ
LINELNTFNTPFSELFVTGSGVTVKDSNMVLKLSIGNAAPTSITVGAGNGSANPGTGTLELDNVSATYSAPTWIRYTSANVLIDKSKNNQIALFNSTGGVLDMVTLSTSSSCSYTNTYWDNPGSCNTCVPNVGASTKDYFRLPDGSTTFTNSGAGNSAGGAGGSSGTSNLADTGITVPSGSNGFYAYCISSEARNCSTNQVTANVNLVFQSTSLTPMCSSPFVIPKSGTAISFTGNIAPVLGTATVTTPTSMTWTGTTSGDTTAVAKALTFTGVAGNGSGNFSFKVADSALSGISTLGSTLSCSSLDHFSLSASASGVANCETVDITVTGHDASNTAVAIPSGTVITLTATRTSGTATGNKGDWTTMLVSGSGTLANGTADDGIATVTTTASQNSFTVRFQNTWSQTAQFTAAASGVSGTTPSGEKPSVTFAPASMRFVDSSSNAISSITPTAGQASSTVYLQAVNSGTCSSGSCTGACTNLFPTGSSTNVNLDYVCSNPTTCQSGQTLSINGATYIQGNNAAAAPSYTSTPLTFNATNSGGPTNAAPITVNYSDVGNIMLGASTTTTVNGASTTLTATSASFRVKPYDFGVSGAITSTCGSFVYMGDTAAIQPSSSSHVIAKARNASGAITPNYQSGYGSLATATLAARDASSGIVTLNSAPSCSAGWSATGCDLGTGWTVAINRASSSTPSSPISPVSFKVSITDPNAETLCGASCVVDGTTPLGSVAAYYGRLRMSNAFGSEILPLSVPVYTEYWDGSVWKTASASPVVDSCTAIAVPTSGSGLTLTLSGSGTSTASMANGTSSGSVTTGSGTFYQGSGRLTLTAPGSGTTGYADISLLAPPWLVYGGIANNSTARAAFGIYNQLGNSKKIIFRREVR